MDVIVLLAPTKTSTIYFSFPFFRKFEQDQSDSRDTGSFKKKTDIEQFLSAQVKGMPESIAAAASGLG